MPLQHLPESLQHTILLEWVSPLTVCAAARAGSTNLRRVVLTSPRPYRSTENEYIPYGCREWFMEHDTSVQLVLNARGQQRRFSFLEARGHTIMMFEPIEIQEPWFRCCWFRCCGSRYRINCC